MADHYPSGWDRPPAGFQEGLDYVSESQKEACSACDSVVKELCDESGGTLAECATAVATVCRSLVGRVRTEQEACEVAINKVLDRVFKEASDALYVAAGGLESAGVNYPFDHNVRTMLLESDPADWLPIAVPAFQRFNEGRTDNSDPCKINPADPSCGYTGPPIVPPGPPAVPPTVPQPPTVPCIVYEMRSGVPTPVPAPGDCPPGGGDGLPVPPPTVPPPVEPPTVPPPPIDGGQCCAPDNVVINVTGGAVTFDPSNNQPIVILPPPGSPPPPAPPDDYPTCPPTAPPVVEVENKVNVTVPDPAAGPRIPGVPNGLGGVVFGNDSPINWTVTAPCYYLSDHFQTLNKRYSDQSPNNEVDPQSAPSFFSRMAAPFKDVLGRDGQSTQDWIKKLTTATIGTPAIIAEGAWSLAYDIFGLLSDAEIPNRGAAKYYGGRVGQAVWAERISGFPMTYVYQSELYAFNAANPQLLPTQTAIDALWAKGRIEDDVWECWTKAHGNIPQWARMYRDTLIGQTDISELIQLKLRKEITSEQFFERTKSIGWGPTSDVTDKLKLAIQLPTQTDLLRMMVRDSADDTVADKYKYDTDFERKFAGKIKDWSEAQGVPADIFKYFWRAHWVIPSNTQLYEMGQRFRPDRPEVERWDALASQTSLINAIATLGPRPLVVTQDDVRQALQINDQAPGWIPALMGISYNPMTRTDATRAFEIGAITAEQLYHRMRDVGYNEADSRTLVDFYQQQSNRRAANATGVLTIRKVVKYYKEYAITRLDAEQKLSRLVKSPDRIAALLDGAEQERVADHTQAMIRLLKKKYLSGDVLAGEVEQTLMANGVQAIDVATLVRRWDEIRRSTDKHVTAAKLCRWAKLRLIDGDEYRRRLYALGYREGDVERLMAECAMGK